MDRTEELFQAAEKRFLNGEYLEAARGFDEVLKSDPNHVAALECRGRCDQTLGNIAGAEASYARVLELDPRAVISLINQGVIFHGRQDLEGALDLYTRALEVEPENLYALQNRSNLLRAQGDLEGARRDLERALRSNSDHGGLHESLGYVLNATGRRHRGPGGDRARREPRCHILRDPVCARSALAGTRARGRSRSRPRRS